MYACLPTLGSPKSGRFSCCSSDSSTARHTAIIVSEMATTRIFPLQRVLGGDCFQLQLPHYGAGKGWKNVVVRRTCASTCAGTPIQMPKADGSPLSSGRREVPFVEGGAGAEEEEKRRYELEQRSRSFLAGLSFEDDNVCHARVHIHAHTCTLMHTHTHTHTHTRTHTITHTASHPCSFVKFFTSI